MSLSHSARPRVPGRAAPPPRWLAPVALIVASLLLTPGVADAQGVSLPVGPTSGCSTTATAATSPFLRLFVNGVCTDLTSGITPTGTGTWTLAPTTLNIAGTTVNVTAQFQSDPFITFTASTKNAVPGSVTYAFLFGEPVVPAVYTSASSSGGLSVSPGAAQNTTVAPDTVYPAFISGYGTQGPLATNLGVDIGHTACVATGIATTTCNFGVANSTFSPTFFDNLEALLTYDQNDFQSAAAFTGRIDLNTAATTITPEPESLSLLTTGLLALGGVAYRRRRRTA